jgi:hypothetical protein
VLFEALDALAAIQAEARQIKGGFSGWHVWLSSLDRWWAPRQVSRLGEGCPAQRFELARTILSETI